jgi:hypothetical protein
MLPSRLVIQLLMPDQILSCGDTSREPIVAAKHMRYLRVAPWSYIVVGYGRVSAKKSFDQIARDVEYKDNGFQSSTAELIAQQRNDIVIALDSTGIKLASPGDLIYGYSVYHHLYDGRPPIRKIPPSIHYDTRIIARHVGICYVM